MSAVDAPALVRVAVDPKSQGKWEETIARGLESLPGVTLAAADTSPADIDYLVYNVDSGLHDLTPFTGLRAVLNTWAGVEELLEKATLPPGVPICRMAERGLTEGMVEYVTGHVMRHHLGIDSYRARSLAGVWDAVAPPLARDRTVGILGFGTLGQACAAALIGLGFQVHGWARTKRSVEGVTCHAGPDGLDAILSVSEILVLLLPQTPATTHVLNAASLARLPKGACIVNAGRGPLIDDDALLAALESGHVAHATLDVFVAEPLPEGHPFWGHENVTVTPHIASVTRIETAVESIVEQIARDRRGDALRHVVDQSHGY